MIMAITYSQNPSIFPGLWIAENHYGLTATGKTKDCAYKNLLAKELQYDEFDDAGDLPDPINVNASWNR